MGKFLGFILLVLVCYIILKVIKRLFFVRVFKSFNDFPQNDSRGQQNSTNSNRQKEFKKDIKWDAETVEYEEIPDEKNKK